MDNKEEEPKKIHDDLIKKLQTDPLTLYEEFSKRINEHGIHAEFPEFAPVVHYLKKKVHSNDINNLCSQDKHIRLLREQLDLELASVSISKSWYPYDSTIRAIYLAIKFFDFVERITKDLSNMEYYHSYRYLYYLDRLIDQAPTIFIFPTYKKLGATDMLKMFGSPIYIVGVNTKCEYVDEFVQTPSEFFIHDINHIRRFSENNESRYVDAADKGIARMDYYKTQRGFMSELIEMITINKTMNPEEKNIRQALKMILFEILHEEAEPPIKEIVCESVLRPSSDTYIGPKGAKFNEIGVSKDGVVDIVPVTTPGASLLSFVRFKLWYGFYDTINSINPLIASLESRKVHVIADAAQRLLSTICETPNYDIAKLKNLIEDNKGLNEPRYDSVFDIINDPYSKEVKRINESIPFTGIRPETKKMEVFDDMYENNKIPWTGIEKPDTSNFQLLNPKYNMDMDGGTINYFTRMIINRSRFLIDRIVDNKKNTIRRTQHSSKKTRKNKKNK